MYLRVREEAVYLLDLGPHGRGDASGGDELEGGHGVVGVMDGKLHHQPHLVAAQVGGDHAAPVQSIHLDPQEQNRHHHITLGLTDDLERLPLTVALIIIIVGFRYSYTYFPI